MYRGTEGHKGRGAGFPEYKLKTILYISEPLCIHPKPAQGLTLSWHLVILLLADF